MVSEAKRSTCETRFECANLIFNRQRRSNTQQGGGTQTTTNQQHSRQRQTTAPAPPPQHTHTHHTHTPTHTHTQGGKNKSGLSSHPRYRTRGDFVALLDISIATLTKTCTHLTIPHSASHNSCPSVDAQNWTREHVRPHTTFVVPVPW